jgi:hypothetical protein
MVTIFDIIERLLPDGTSKGSRKSWTRPPMWPPDLFAVTASLVDRSDCYAGRPFGGSAGSNSHFRPEFRSQVEDAAKRWRDDFRPPLEVLDAWSVLMKSAKEPIRSGPAVWHKSAVFLMTVSDQASAGIGFPDDNPSMIEKVAAAFYLKAVSSKGKTNRDQLSTLCQLVPANEVCVQPKALTSPVGCTLRSLSHHLALVPPVSCVRSSWQFTAHSESTKPLNLLLVPYPYRIQSDAFLAGSPFQVASMKSARFHLKQTWLPKQNAPDLLHDLVSTLIDEAEREVGEVNGVVFPEAALDSSLAKELSRRLCRRKHLEFFVSGALSPAKKDGLGRNESYTALFSKQEILVDWSQSKHHRWRLNKSQVQSYQLSRVLNPKLEWWEGIDIGDRSVTFSVFRSGACLAVLICEDLARVDPVQPLMRAVGPNLVIALLQDGPQLKDRWPAMYAATLSDDPGSSVLTLTSLGMVERSSSVERSSRVVALWKDPVGGARELSIPFGSHALLLQLGTDKFSCESLDGRTDNGASVRFLLEGVRAVSLRSIPKWLS